MPRKSFGPFTGTQLTILGVALVFGVPSTALAAGTFTSVVIQDPTSGAKAGVDPTHHLQAAVSGSVTAMAAPPANLVHVLGFANSVTCTRIYTPPAGKALIVIEATANLQDPSGITEIDIFRDSTCTAANELARFTTDRSAETVQQTYPTGVVSKSGLYAFVGNGGNNSQSVSASGYLVPTSSVP